MLRERAYDGCVHRRSLSFNGLGMCVVAFFKPYSGTSGRKMTKKVSKYCFFENLFLYLWSKCMYEHICIIQT